MRWRLSSGLRTALVTLLAVIALGLTWLRDDDWKERQSNIMRHAALVTGDRTFGPFMLAGAWRLSSDDTRFNSLSGLAVADENHLVAVSDRGFRVVFGKPGRSRSLRITPLQIGERHKFAIRDSEAIVRDQASGLEWVAVENHGSIARFGPGSEDAPFVQPDLMRHWPANQGPETLFRLDDGRFVVVSESRSAGTGKLYPALLFGDDPLESGEPDLFYVDMPGHFSPVDAAPLPDGRILVLGRYLALPFRFRTMVGIADPRDIGPGRTWTIRPLAKMDGFALSDNYEGIAVEAMPAGRITVWLVSDENLSHWLQRTLLLKLEVDAAAL